jgi:Zn-finger nucleic acid-binding protein
MKCPICDIEMRISDRDEIEIDYCPQCRGVWLDRGELEKIIAGIVIQCSADSQTNADRRERDADIGCERNDNLSANERVDRDTQTARSSQKREGFFSALLELFGKD